MDCALISNNADVTEQIRHPRTGRTQDLELGGGGGGAKGRGYERGGGGGGGREGLMVRYEASETLYAQTAHAHVLQQLFNFHVPEFSTTRFDVRLTHSRSLSL